MRLIDRQHLESRREVGAGKFIQNRPLRLFGDQQRGLGVAQYVAEFAAAVAQVDWNHDRASFERRQVGDDELGPVAQKQGDAVPFLHAHAHECGCPSLRLPP